MTLFNATISEILLMSFPLQFYSLGFNTSIRQKERQLGKLGPFGNKNLCFKTLTRVLKKYMQDNHVSVA